MELGDVKEILEKYKEELNCKSPKYFDYENYKELKNKDKLILQLFEYII